jgi:hypothetical protein
VGVFSGIPPAKMNARFCEISEKRLTNIMTSIAELEMKEPNE